MSKFIKKFNNYNFYQQTSFNTNNTPNVSLCKLENNVYYNHYIPSYPKFLDILYSDAKGNLSFTSEVLPVSEGKTPIALCIAEPGFFGTNELARWMSLKHMNYNTPETGSTSALGMYFGNSNVDIPTIYNLQVTHNGGSSTGYMDVDYHDNSSSQSLLPKIYDENNNWNISVLGTANMYIMTDINGKKKTAKIIETATAQSNWRYAETIDNQPGAGYAPAACCCARYHTLGTDPGDWYLGAAGEMLLIMVNKTVINTKLHEIKTIYPQDSVNNVYGESYWSSTEFGSNMVMRIYMDTARLYRHEKNKGLVVCALLQY